ncbi:MAG TPA: hypothetical protein VGH39_02500 [Xanthobacteraceae bacterium]
MPAKVITPVVVSLGIAREHHLNEFRGGAGRIADDVQEVMKLLRGSMPPEQDHRVLLPVVVVYADEQ